MVRVRVMIIEIGMMIEYSSTRMVTEHTPTIKTHRWPNGVLAHGGAYASIININKKREPSALNIVIYRPPLRNI